MTMTNQDEVVSMIDGTIVIMIVKGTEATKESDEMIAIDATAIANPGENAGMNHNMNNKKTVETTPETILETNDRMETGMNETGIMIVSDNYRVNTSDNPMPA